MIFNRNSKRFDEEVIKINLEKELLTKLELSFFNDIYVNYMLKIIIVLIIFVLILLLFDFFFKKVNLKKKKIE